MLKWLLRIVVIVLLIVGAYALRVTVLAPDPILVQVVLPQRGLVEATATNSKAGTIKARRRADISPEIGGRVVELPARKGATVRAGDVLLRLDDSSYVAELEQAERNVVTAEARHREACLAAEQAEREANRYVELAARQIVSQNLLDQLRSRAATSAAGCEAAAAAVNGSRSAITVLNNARSKTVLRAPFPGTVAEVSIEIGEFTTPSPPGLPIPPVMEIIDTSSIYVSAPMDEVDSARIHPGQRVRVTIDPYPGQSFAGTVVRIAPYVLDIEAQNRTVEIDVELDDEAFAARLLPGTSADVEIILEVHEDVLRIPTPTLLEGSAVLVVEGNILTRREITLGLRNWDFVEVQSGLTTADRVVTSLDRVDVQAGAEVVVEGSGPDS